MGKMFRLSIQALAGFMVFAGLCLLIADSNDFTAFIWSKVFGGILAVGGLVIVAHLEEKGGTS